MISCLILIKFFNKIKLIKIFQTYKILNILNGIILSDRNQIIPKHYTVSCKTSAMLRYPLVTMWFWFSISIIYKLDVKINQK